MKQWILSIIILLISMSCFASKKSSDDEWRSMLRPQGYGSPRGGAIFAETFNNSHRSGFFILQVFDSLNDLVTDQTLNVFDLFSGGPIGTYGRDYAFGWVARFTKNTGVESVGSAALQVTFENLDNSFGHLLKTHNIQFWIQVYPYKTSDGLGRSELFSRYSYKISRNLLLRGFFHYYYFSKSRDLVLTSLDLIWQFDPHIDIYFRLNYASNIVTGLTLFRGLDAGVGIRINIPIDGGATKTKFAGETFQMNDDL